MLGTMHWTVHYIQLIYENLIQMWTLLLQPTLTIQVVSHKSPDKIYKLMILKKYMAICALTQTTPWLLFMRSPFLITCVIEALFFMSLYYEELLISRNIENKHLNKSLSQLWWLFCQCYWVWGNMTCITV